MGVINPARTRLNLTLAGGEGRGGGGEAARGPRASRPSIIRPRVRNTVRLSLHADFAGY